MKKLVTSSYAAAAHDYRNKLVMNSFRALTICAVFLHCSGVAESGSRQEMQRLLGVELTIDEAEALAAWYSSLARGVAAFPAADLRRVEPPLRSVPAPLIQQ